MIKRLLLLACVALPRFLAYGSETTDGIDPQHIYYLYLKDNSIIKVDQIGKSDDPAYIQVTNKVDGVLRKRKIATAQLVQIKVEKRPAEKPSEEAVSPAITKTLLDLGTDPTSNLDKRINVERAVLTLSTYFNYGYRDSRYTHLSFEMKDGTARGHVYVSKDWEGAEILRQRALKNGAVGGIFTITLRSDRFDSASSEVLAELVSYSIPKGDWPDYGRIAGAITGFPL